LSIKFHTFLTKPTSAAVREGDYMPYTFRQAKLGTLVGKKTWGGRVGVGGYPSLLDGSSVTAPHWALWFSNGKWDVSTMSSPPHRPRQGSQMEPRER
jgi:hypothetical protein